MKPVQDLRIEEMTPLVPPARLKADLPTTDALTEQVYAARESVKRILSKDDPRLLVVVGPCSIHDPVAALEYARRLRVLAADVQETMLILMRVYFEKPRTTIGWKGLISDPHLDNTSDIAAGLRIARALLLEINELGLPAATEMLDPIIPQYIADLIAWSAIGARTTESQTHREMASGLGMPVGFKNATNGAVQVAIDAIQSARAPHSFIGIDASGITTIVKTRGNPYCHVVLRGGSDGPNYEPSFLAAAAADLRKAGVDPAIMVDCSHANSRKKHENQVGVLQSIVEQRIAGNRDLVGAMVESNINGGNQKLNGGLSTLQYGVSITDACIDWDTTNSILRHAHAALRGKI